MDGPSVYKWWHAMWAQVCNLLFPRGCAGCDAPDEVLCAACWALFAQCRERDADSGGGARIWSASIYQGAVRRAILDWKDHDDTELDGPFGRIMVSLLNKQVEEVTDGAISASTMGAALSAGVSLSVGLAMVRVLTGISILWFLIPGYAFAIGISFVVPKLYTAIAFDAGGVASGPMTATFLLPLAQGACIAVGGNIVTDAFGVVAMVAMTPLITVQLMGLMAQLKQRRARQAQPMPAAALVLADLPDDAIIEL